MRKIYFFQPFIFIWWLFITPFVISGESFQDIALLEASDVFHLPHEKSFFDKEVDAYRATKAYMNTRGSIKWVDDTRETWSQNVVGIGRYIDNLMGSVDHAQDENKSYLKLDFRINHSKYGKTDVEPRVRFSVDLPILKEKLRLVFESEPDQAKGIGERELDIFPSTEKNNQQDDVYASFRYLIDARKWTRLSFDTGVKIRFRPDLFTRARAVRSWAMSDYWSFRLSQELFWFESRGLGTQTQFNFDRPLSKLFLFRKTASIDWSERDSRFDFLNQFSVFHSLSEKRTIQYALGMTSDYQGSHILANNYFGRVIFRSSLYKHWLFYQLETGVEFPKDEAFRANPFVGFRLEVLFADDAAKRLSARLD